MDSSLMVPRVVVRHCEIMVGADPEAIRAFDALQGSQGRRAESVGRLAWVRRVAGNTNHRQLLGCRIEHEFKSADRTAIRLRRRDQRLRRCVAEQLGEMLDKFKD